MHSKSQEKKLTMQNMHYITIHKKLSPLKYVPPKNSLVKRFYTFTCLRKTKLLPTLTWKQKFSLFTVNLCITIKFSMVVTAATLDNLPHIPVGIHFVSLAVLKNEIKHSLQAGVKEVPEVHRVSSEIGRVPLGLCF